MPLICVILIQITLRTCFENKVLRLIHTVSTHLFPYAYTAPTFAAWKKHIETKYYSRVTTCGWIYGSNNSIFKGGHRVVTCQVRQTERTVNHNNILAKTLRTVVVNHKNTVWTTVVIDNPIHLPEVNSLCFYLPQLPCKQTVFTWRHIIPRSLTIYLAFVDPPYFLFFIHKRQDFRKMYLTTWISFSLQISEVF